MPEKRKGLERKKTLTPVKHYVSEDDGHYNNIPRYNRRSQKVERGKKKESGEGKDRFSTCAVIDGKREGVPLPRQYQKSQRHRITLATIRRGGIKKTNLFETGVGEKMKTFRDKKVCLERGS